MIRIRRVAGVAICCIVALTGCSSVTSGTPIRMSGSVTTSTASSAPTSSTSSTDRQVCAGEDGLEQRGKAFYPTYKQLMLANGGGVSVTPVELSAQLAVLTTVAAADGKIDGAAVINLASPQIRLAVSKMIRDADRLAQHYADVAKGGLSANSDLTPIITSFTEALVECAKGGYQPTWFKPEELGAR